MRPLEQLFRLEIEFHRRLRREAPDAPDPASLHTSYALQAGYEPLLKGMGRVAARDVDQLAERLAAAGDPRDVGAARDALVRLLGLGTERG